MLNYEAFSKENQPTEDEIKDFIGTNILAVFSDLDNHLREDYKVKPKFAYSSCAMDGNIWRGWNIKYQKSGKSLCKIYPQQDYFLVLIPGKWFEVRSKDVANDVKLAIATRFNEISAKKKA